MRRYLLAAVAMMAALVFVQPVLAADQVYGPPAPNTVTLAPSVPHATSKLAGYVHLANCKAALTGANGDNDIQAYLNANGYNGWGWSQGYEYWRQDNTHLVVFFDVYSGGSFQGGRAAYCMGDDSNIVDKAGSAPSGW